jgi:hypothetical protein
MLNGRSQKIKLEHRKVVHLLRDDWNVRPLTESVIAQNAPHWEQKGENESLYALVESYST